MNVGAFQLLLLVGVQPILSGVAAAPLLAQQSAPPTAPPSSCAGAVQRTVERIERDYVAFPLEVTTDRLDQWHQRVRDVQARASDADRGGCSWLLRQLTSFFHDGHLAIIDMPAPDSVGLAQRRANRPVRQLTTAQARAVVANSDVPLVGIWRGPGYRVAVLPDSESAGTKLIGVVVAVDSGPWRPGMVRAEFELSAGEWRATVWDDAFLAHTSPVERSRDAMLRMAPLIWSREFPERVVATLDSTDVRRPLVRYVDDSVAVISVVSFDPMYAKALRDLVQRESSRLQRSAVVVIDLRGNEGGSSLSAEPLMPFLFGRILDVRSARDSSESVVRASASNIRFWERTNWAPRGLIDRLRTAPEGALVSFDPGHIAAWPARPSNVSAPAQRTFIVTDRATVSAAEQVVLWARGLGRATIVGEPTGGSIDYQNAALFRVADAAMGQVLSMPVIAASRVLPANGVNRTGILPDVQADAATVARWSVGSAEWLQRIARPSRTDRRPSFGVTARVRLMLRSVRGVVVRQ